MFRLMFRVFILWCVWSVAASVSAEPPSIHPLPQDLVVPETLAGPPAPGIRVRATAAGWEATAVHHALYLPPEWTPHVRLPVFVEYAGNGGFRNAAGDTCDGTVEGCHLGYGLSGGTGWIWVSMPFVEITADGKQNASKWWGDVEETKRYCLATVRDVCARFGGDVDRVILGGFSRGAIACNRIGLDDDEIAGLWRGFFCHSHYDGARPALRYPGGEPDAVLGRLARLGNRPQWISHETSVDVTRDFLRSTGIEGRFTFEALPFPNHTDTWVLRDLPLRAKAREWLREAVR